MVSSKGLDAHAVKMVTREVRMSGYPRLISKSDQEPCILALLEAVRRGGGKQLISCERHLLPENINLMGE